MKPLRRILLAMAACAAPASAQAHLVASGMGPIYDGISHFGLSPEDYLPVIALAFFAGLRGARHTRWTLGALTFAWLLGGALAFAGLVPPPIVLPAATAILFLLIGGLLAANPEWPPAVCMGAALGLGLVRGMSDLSGVSATLPHVLSLVGMDASVFAVFALACSITLPLQRLWMVVAARVSGSWLAALGLLFAGWILRYGAKIQ